MREKGLTTWTTSGKDSWCAIIPSICNNVSSRESTRLWFQEFGNALKEASMDVSTNMLSSNHSTPRCGTPVNGHRLLCTVFKFLSTVRYKRGTECTHSLSPFIYLYIQNVLLCMSFHLSTFKVKTNHSEPLSTLCALNVTTTFSFEKRGYNSICVSRSILAMRLTWR